MHHLASVVIPCYNCDAYLESTLRSVREQTYPNVELVLVDDGSTDNTRSIIERHSDDAACHFGPNRGASAARTTGTELAQGEYVQYLDADDALRPTALEERIAALQNADADVAYSKYQLLVSRNGAFREGPVVEETLEEIHPDPELATLGHFWLPPAALTYSRRIVDAIGAWSEELPVIQDARFLQDAAFHGGTFVKVDQVLAEYRDHDSGSLSTQNRLAFHRDVWVNVRQIEERWRKRDGRLSEEQRDTLARAYDYCARSFFPEDEVLFRQAADRAYRLRPHGRSRKLSRYQTLVRLLGYSFPSAVRRMLDRGLETSRQCKKIAAEFLPV